MTHEQLTQSGLVFIANDGADIADTNYFDHPYAAAGYLFFSFLTGAARLLVPDNQTHHLDDMATANEVLITRGPYPELDASGREVFEVLFEDHTDKPFAVHLSTNQADKVLGDHHHGANITVSVWTRDGCALRRPGVYQVVSQLPCMQRLHLP